MHLTKFQDVLYRLKTNLKKFGPIRFLASRTNGTLCMLVLFVVVTFIIKIRTVTSPTKKLPDVRELAKCPKITNITCNCSKPVGMDEVIVKLDQIMKGPVALEQDDPRLIQRIRQRHLNPPSTKAYNISVDTDSSEGRPQAIREIMGDVRNGFFIECGALDGETRSNSLVFEKTLGWTGLLVEGDPKNYKMVLDKNRKAWTAGVCLSTKPYPMIEDFLQELQVQCLPIYSLLLAVNTTTVDYFSLDVEGVELEVLQTIPWDKVNIKTLSVEFLHGQLAKKVLCEYMGQQGYWTYKQVSHTNTLAKTFIFVKRSYKKPEEVIKQNHI